MSKENVEIVRRSLEAYSRRDVDALRTLNHPELELDWSASRGSLAGVYRGFEEALRFYAEYYEVFEATVIKPDGFVETGDLVVVPNVAHQRGRDGIEVTARSTLVFAVHNRQITRICLYQNEDEALTAVGLEGRIGCSGSGARTQSPSAADNKGKLRRSPPEGAERSSPT